MNQSGLLVDKEARTAYRKMNIGTKYKYIIIKINNGKLVIDVKGERKKIETRVDVCCNQEILKHCKSEPRYILCYYCTPKSYQGKEAYLSLIFW